jgi:hypothetical protein
MTEIYFIKVVNNSTKTNHWRICLTYAEAIKTIRQTKVCWGTHEIKQIFLAGR